MRPLIHLRARLLMRCAVIVSVIGFCTQVAVGDFTPTPVIRSVEEIRFKDIVRVPRKPAVGSNLELIARWLELKHPQIQSGLNSILPCCQAISSTHDRLVNSQRIWLQENLLILIEGFDANPERFIGAWLFDGFMPQNPSDEDLESQLGLSELRNAYWDYYQDCDRWGVNLTRTLHDAEPKIATVAASSSSTADLAEQPLDSSPVASERNLKVLKQSISQASAWLGQLLRQVEFATIEAPAASNRETRRQQRTQMY